MNRTDFPQSDKRRDELIRQVRDDRPGAAAQLKEYMRRHYWKTEYEKPFGRVSDWRGGAPRRRGAPKPRKARAPLLLTPVHGSGATPKT